MRLNRATIIFKFIRALIAQVAAVAMEKNQNVDRHVLNTSHLTNVVFVQDAVHHGQQTYQQGVIKIINVNLRKKL